MFETIRILDSYRPRSQDRAEVIRHRSGIVIVLADGAGGTSGGTDAAETVIMWARTAVDDIKDFLDASHWVGLLSKIDYQISCADQGQTTAVILAVTADGICGASVGDSVAWIIRPDDCLNLTINQITKPLIGSGSAKPVPFAAPRLDGTLMVASDGLAKYASRERICATALGKNFTEVGRKLVDLARLRSGTLQDDVSLVLCR